MESLPSDMDSSDVQATAEGNGTVEDEDDRSIGSDNCPADHFTVDRKCIPTVGENEQEAELSGLDIQVYNQEILEQGILDQVDQAFKDHMQKRPDTMCKLNKRSQNQNEKSEDVDMSVRSTESTLSEETETEKKIRMGEMTPFGTEICMRRIEGNNFEKIEEYLKKQVQSLKDHKSKLIKKTPEKSSSGRKRKSSPSPRKQHSNHMTTNPSSRTSVDTLPTSNGKSQSGDSSGSEYLPSADSDGSDTNYEIKPKSKKLKKTRKATESEEDVENCGTSTRVKSRTKEKDDGDETEYLLRVEKWEKENGQDEMEAELKVVDGDFKVPSFIWNKLYNYQRVGVQWLWELNVQRCGGILGDEMGLGKTIQVIAFLIGLKVSKLVSRHGSYRGLGPVLIACPTTVMHQWVREFHKWWPRFRVALLHESGSFNGHRRDLIRQIVKANGILITSYVTCIQQSADLLRWKWHYVILDEGHKIRNPESQVATTVKQLQTPHRLILSGSPIQNNLKELWSLFDFVFPAKLGTLPVFLAEFGVPITQGGYANATKVQVATACKCATVLRDTIAPYLLRRAKEDVKSHINLPPKNEQVLFCRLTREQKDLYLNYLNSGRVNEILCGKQKVFVGLIALRKICNHPHLYSGGPKLTKWDNPEFVPEDEKYGYWNKAGKMIVMETLLKIWKKQGHRVLIFSQSRKMLDILEMFIQSQSYEYIKVDGSTTIGSRQPLITKFNEDKKYYIFLSTTHVGGLGVNLTGANRVVIYDPDWNPATDMQARERAWRIGQENQVTIYRLVTSGTIEEKIYHRQIFKQFLTNKVLKDPRQRRFFKSNDLYELFTYKDDETSNETSAIFAGTNLEVNLKNLKRSKRVRLREDVHLEPESVRNAADAQKLLTKEKIEKMKRMAQMLSRKIGMDAGHGGGPEPSTGDRSDRTIGNGESRASGDGPGDSKEPEVRPREVEEVVDQPVESRKKSKKGKRKKSGDACFDGEVVPHLKKQKNYCDVIQESKRDARDDDDYILKKLFSKSGVQSALKHDQIMGEGEADYALVEGEAEKIAKEAVKALRESRRQYGAAGGVGTIGGTPTQQPVKLRFGAKNIKRRGVPLPSSSSSTDHVEGKDKFMSSTELLDRIRQRNGLCSETSNENSELLADIRNFISLGADAECMASTQEIVNRFRDRLPTSQTPLFKALLNQICEFRRTSSGEGIWELRQEFRW